MTKTNKWAERWAKREQFVSEIDGEIPVVKPRPENLRPPATREQLDHLQCATLGCTEKHTGFYLHAICHPGSSTWVHYATGVITVECAQCGKVVVRIAVAKGQES